MPDDPCYDDSEYCLKCSDILKVTEQSLCSKCLIKMGRTCKCSALATVLSLKATCQSGRIIQVNSVIYNCFN